MGREEATGACEGLVTPNPLHDYEYTHEYEYEYLLSYTIHIMSNMQSYYTHILNSFENHTTQTLLIV